MLVHWFSSMERCGLSEMNLDIEVDEVNEQQHGVISCGSCFLLSESSISNPLYTKHAKV